MGGIQTAWQPNLRSQTLAGWRRLCQEKSTQANEKLGLLKLGARDVLVALDEACVGIHPGESMIAKELGKAGLQIRRSSRALARLRTKIL